MDISVFIVVYLIGCGFMLAIRIAILLIGGEITLSDLVTLPIYSMLSVFGIGAIMVIALCHLVDRIMDRGGKNRVLWSK